MMIDADPNNNRTITTLYNDTKSHEIDSKFNHSQSTTILDDTKNLIIEDDTTTLYNITPSTKVEIDHTFDDNSLDITTPTVDVHTEAEGDYNTKSLTSFNLKVNSSVPDFIELDYKRDNPKGHLLTVNASNSLANVIANITYDEMKNEYYWNESVHFRLIPSSYFSYYYAIINESGVWVNDARVINWKDAIVSRYNSSNIHQMINITEADNNTIVLRYSVIGFVKNIYPIYELIFTKTGSSNITMEYVIITTNDDFSFVWEHNIISIFGELGEPAIVVVFYLWYIASDKLYIFMASDFEIEFHWTVIIIYVVSIVIKIWLIEEFNYIYWEIEYIWLAWIISIEIWFDLNAWTLLAYLIKIKFSIYIYIYSVPTYFFPNQLFINIVKLVCYNTSNTAWWFNITVEIKSFAGNLINATLTGTWNGITIQPGNITQIETGIYNLNLTGHLVDPSLPEKILNLNATRAGFYNGILTAEIKIDPEIGDAEKELPPPTPKVIILPSGDDDDDDDGEEAAIIPGFELCIILGIVAIVSIAIILKKRKFVELT